MSFSIDQFLASLNEKFVNFNISYQNLSYNGNMPVFFVRSPTEEDLADSWTKLVDAIAFDFQSQLTDEFQIWNIYVFFIHPLVVANLVSFNSLKLQIENDTFSSRKIVVEDDEQENIINEHIINSNVNFFPDRAAHPSAQLDSNPLLWSILEDRRLKKQRMTSEAGSAFDELVNKLKIERL